MPKAFFQPTTVSLSLTRVVEALNILRCSGEIGLAGSIEKELSLQGVHLNLQTDADAARVSSGRAKPKTMHRTPSRRT